MKLIAKASEEKGDFYELIGTQVTFDSEIISIGGQIMHEKGEKAIISDVEYTPGHFSRGCPNIYIHPKISAFKINGITSTCWIVNTFLEFKTIK